MYKEETFNLNELEIKPLKVYALNGKLFNTEKDVQAYLGSCEAEVLTYNFFFEKDDFTPYYNESDLRYMADVSDEDSSEEAENKINEMFEKYSSYVENLLDKYEIDADLQDRGSDGPEYILSGRLGNLLKFSNLYSKEFTYSEGALGLEEDSELFSDVRENTQVDIGSGTYKSKLDI